MNMTDIENSTLAMPVEYTEYYYMDSDIDAVLYQRYEKNRAVSEMVRRLSTFFMALVS
jgi:hypothetical protein